MLDAKYANPSETGVGDRLKSHGNGILSEARGAEALFAWLKRTGVPLPEKWLGGYGE
jgi:hypothetical protein